MRSALVAGALVAGLLVAGCGARSSPLPSPAGTGSWTTIQAVAPVPLLEVAVAERSGRIWVAGGDGHVYVLLGGRQPGLATSDITETLALP